MSQYQPEPWDDHDREVQARAHEAAMGERRRRQTIAFLSIAALVAVVGLAAAALAQGWINIGSGSANKVACPTPTIAAAKQTKVRILNATDRAGLASKTANEFKARGFQVAGVGNSDEAVRSVAVVVYGPGTERQARAVSAQIRGAVYRNDSRAGDVVDLLIGDSYRSLIPAAQITMTPAPSPAGCVTPSP